MRIGIAGPLGTPDLGHLLDGDTSYLPREMKGSSLLVTLIGALIQDGHEVVAFTTDPALVPRIQNRVRAQGKNFTIHYVPRRRHSLRWDRGARGRMLDLFALERRALADMMRTDPPEIIHAHWTYEFAAAALDTGIPCLITCHDSPWAILKTLPNLYRLSRLLMAKSVLSRMRYATVVSPYLIDELRNMTNAPLSVVPNPISDAIFNAGYVRTAPDLRSRSPQIAMLLNGWSSRKNPEAGMLAMKHIRAKYPDARMHLYGPDYGPGERAHMWAKTHRMEDAFIFHGWMPHVEVMHELAGMHLLLHPAIEESFGLTVAEAMALGLPVVAGKHSGAVPWVLGIREGCGALVDVQSPVQIADAISTILSDPCMYVRYSQCGRTRASTHFSATAVARSYLELYRSVLKQSGAEVGNLARVHA